VDDAHERVAKPVYEKFNVCYERWCISKPSLGGRTGDAPWGFIHSGAHGSVG